MVVESIDSATPTQPSKLRVPGSIPGAPTTKPLKTNGEGQTPPGPVEDVPSANQGLSGAKLRNNCGSQPPPAPAWRSMASAPGQHVRILLKRDDGAVVVARRIGTMDLWHEQGCLDGYDWCGQYIAWAPIPDWTGEVAE